MIKKNVLTVIAVLCCMLLPLVVRQLPAEEIGNPYESYLEINYLLNLNDFGKAEALIDRFLEKHPEDPFILTEKAVLALNIKNDTDAALTLLGKALAMYPGYYYSNYLLASILFTNYPEDEKKVNRAIKHLELSIHDNDEFYDSHYLMGIILNDREKYAESNRAFERANRLEQKFTAYYYMGSNYHELKDVAGEIAAYKKILELSPFNYKALRSLSQIYMEQEDYKNAAIYLEQLFTSNPGTRKIAVEYLYSLFAAGEDEKFLKISEMVDIKDSNLLIYAKALILSRKNKEDEAIKLLESINPKDSRSYLLMSEIYIRKQDYYRAYQILDKIEAGKRDFFYYSLKLQTLSLLNLNRRTVSLFERLCKDPSILEKLSVSDFYTAFYAYANLDRLDRLRETAGFVKAQVKQESVQLNDLVRRLKDFSTQKKMTVDGPVTGFFPNLYLLLTFYKNRHSYQDAISVLEEVIKLTQGKNPAPYLELCDIYLKQGKFTSVKETLQKLLKQFPDSGTVKNFYAYFLALRGEELEQALKLSAQTLKADNDNPAYLDTYGYILYKSDRLEEAAVFLEKAFGKSPFEEEIMEHIVDCLKFKKEHKRIVDIYQNAVDNGVDFKDKLIDKLEKLKQKPGK
jgi:tetratricopeptide (TPR) repeat protein